MVPSFRCRHEGRTRRHERGAECGGHDGAGRRSALAWTAKSCGPGAPKAGAQVGDDASRIAAATVAIGKVHRGERAISR